MVFHIPIVAIITLVSGSAPASAEVMTPEMCGRCHSSEHQKWSRSKHRRVGVQCADCHGELHAGKILGCRPCHDDKHETIFRAWPEVQRFDTPGSGDYLCSVCHQPHRGGLDEHREACKQCHNQSINRDVIAFHTDLFEFFVPTQNDGYVLRESRGVQLAELTHAGFGVVPVTLSLLAFGLGTVLLFPIGLGLALLDAHNSAAHVRTDQISKGCRPRAADAQDARC